MNTHPQPLRSQSLLKNIWASQSNALWQQGYNPRRAVGCRERVVAASTFREGFTEAHEGEVHGEGEGQGAPAEQRGEEHGLLPQHRRPGRCQMGSGGTAVARSRERYDQKGNRISLFFFKC